MILSLLINAGINSSEFNSLSLDTTSAQLLFPKITDTTPKIYSQLRWIKLSSSNPPIDFKQSILSKFQNAKIILGYGLSEYMRAAYLNLSEHSKYLANF